MSVSYPSKTIALLDVPEVSRLSADFRYNFFTPDEKLNSTGDARLQGTLDNEAEYSLKKKIPRWVEFTFDTVDSRTNASVDNHFVLDIGNSIQVENLIYSNLGKINSEIDIISNGYSALNLQDQAIKNKTSSLMRLMLRTHATAKGLNTLPFGNDWQYTNAGASKLFNDITGDYISGDSISRMMGDDRLTSIRIDKNQDNSYKHDRMSEFASIKQYSQISEKYFYDILMKSVADPTTPYANELSYKLADAEIAQTTARESGNNDVISESEYTHNIVPVSITRINDGALTNAVKIIGYIIDKWELLSDRTYKQLESIIVAGSSVGAAVDTSVKYDGVYTYSIRSIALAQFQAVDKNKSQLYAVSGLISSRPSSKITVRCHENLPPPPPTDVDFVWDYDKSKLMIMWSFPVTPTRDIKRFQVFRRSSINVSFELQIEYDFDDSKILTARSERPDPQKIINMKQPMTSYWDEEFNKRSVMIYSLCSIDAHDLSSNYSAQYMVWFDETKNRLVKKLISPSGAPKPYPNFYLLKGSDTTTEEINLTSDCMKDSGHTSCKIYFDPEYLSVMGADNKDLGLWATQQDGGLYKLQLINVDRQKSQIINIKIDDLRTK